MAYNYAHLSINWLFLIAAFLFFEASMLSEYLQDDNYDPPAASDDKKPQEKSHPWKKRDIPTEVAFILVIAAFLILYFRSQFGIPFLILASIGLCGLVSVRIIRSIKPAKSNNPNLVYLMNGLKLLYFLFVVWMTLTAALMGMGLYRAYSIKLLATKREDAHSVVMVNGKVYVGNMVGRSSSAIFLYQPDKIIVLQDHDISYEEQDSKPTLLELLIQ